MSEIILPEGMKIGHDDDGKRTGVTVILAGEGAVGGVSVRGSAPGTRETDLLCADKAVESIHAVVLSGGSAFGLSACDGVMQFLRETGIGYAVGAVKIPLVAGAVIFDLNDGSYTYPDSGYGYRACQNAKADGISWGAVGAGTGAVVGKILGPLCAQKGGIGATTVRSGETFITAVTVVNALGDVIDYKTGKIICGVQVQGKHVGTADLILSGALSGAKAGGNTTLSCLLTNAALTKLQANKLASIAHDGFAKSISPVHTDYDGDTVFALSKGSFACDFTALSVMAVEAVCGSIVNAVTHKAERRNT